MKSGRQRRKFCQCIIYSWVLVSITVIALSTVIKFSIAFLVKCWNSNFITNSMVSILVYYCIFSSTLPSSLFFYLIYSIHAIDWENVILGCNYPVFRSILEAKLFHRRKLQSGFGSSLSVTMLPIFLVNNNFSCCIKIQMRTIPFKLRHL